MRPHRHTQTPASKKRWRGGGGPTQALPGQATKAAGDPDPTRATAAASAAAAATRGRSGRPASEPSPEPPAAPACASRTQPQVPFSLVGAPPTPLPPPRADGGAAGAARRAGPPPVPGSSRLRLTLRGRRLQRRPLWLLLRGRRVPRVAKWTGVEARGVAGARGGRGAAAGSQRQPRTAGRPVGRVDKTIISLVSALINVQIDYIYTLIKPERSFVGLDDL